MLKRKNDGASRAGQGARGSENGPIRKPDPKKISQDLARVQTLSLEDFQALFGGEISGHELRCPGPGHSTVDRSMSIRISDDGSLLVNSFADDRQMCSDHVIEEILSAHCSNPPTTWWERKDLVRSMLGGLGSVSVSPAQVQQDQAKKLEKARAIWRSGRDPHGTPVEQYLQNRCIDLPQREDVSEVIRFVPDCRFGMDEGAARERRVPAMVCLVRDALTDEPVGIHRTAITWKGEKAEHSVNGNPISRMALGAVKTGGNIGAIKLFPGPAPHDGQMTLGVGEGIETTLSLWKMHRIPVWSLLDGPNLGKLPLLRDVEKLVVARDNDKSGIAAVADLVSNWAPIDVFSVKAPYPLNDLNDVLWKKPMARGTGL